MVSPLSSAEEKEIINYASKKTGSTENNYTTTEKEYLAIVWPLEEFRSDLENRHFILYTDHAALQRLNRNKDSWA